MSIVPNRGACVTMLMPLRTMYVSTPSGRSGQRDDVQRVPVAGKDPGEPLAAGHDGYDRGLRRGLTVGFRPPLVGQGRHGHGAVGPGSGWRSGGRSSGPGVRFGT